MPVWGQSAYKFNVILTKNNLCGAFSYLLPATRPPAAGAYGAYPRARRAPACPAICRRSVHVTRPLPPLCRAAAAVTRSRRVAPPPARLPLSVSAASACFCPPCLPLPLPPPPRPPASLRLCCLRPLLPASVCTTIKYPPRGVLRLLMLSAVPHGRWGCVLFCHSRDRIC